MTNQIIYDVDISKWGRKYVSLTVNGHHIGCIWGTVHLGEDNFEREHNIINIRHDGLLIAMLWDALPKGEQEK